MNVDAEILSALRRAGAGSVSGAELSQKLGISRAAIWARIEDLRALGYEIQATPHQGYRLQATPDLLHADDLVSRLGRPGTIGRDIRVFHETSSTNDMVDRLARDGAPEGAVVFAETQTRGRGRLGRKWVSPAGKGIWFSVLLRPPIRPQQATQLTVAAATALRRAIQAQTSLDPEIKWPNDILLSEKKVAGILTEMNAELDRINHLVLGIGVDVNCNASDFPAEFRKSATSLKIELGHPVPRAELAVRVLRELDADYARLIRGAFADVADEWAAHCSTLGKQVLIRTGERQVRGRAESLSEEGSLLVRTEHGHLERIVGGDVILENASGI